MTNVKGNSKFLGLWRRALALPSLNDLHEDLVSGWARQVGLNVLDVAERDVGIFRPTRAIVLTADDGSLPRHHLVARQQKFQ